MENAPSVSVAPPARPAVGVRLIGGALVGMYAFFIGLIVGQFMGGG